MRRHHPNWRSALLVAGVLVVVGSAGCRNQQTPLANPFLAPDRVPPPATRTLAPGTAQPYYPGDPLPAMQSTITPPAATLTAAPAAATPPTPPAAASATADLSSSANTGAPGGYPVTPGTRAVAIAKEQPVGIPGDDQRLRFALPPPAQAVPPAPPAAYQPPVQVASVPAAQPVQPALYTGAAANPPVPFASPTAATITAPAAPTTIDPAQLGPWRAPQITSAPVQPAPAAPAAVPPTISAPAPAAIVAAAQPSMSVRLRPVPSPVAQLSPSPRIRLPGYTSTFQQPIVAGGTAQQATFVAPPSVGTLQTVQITALPPSAPPAADVTTPSVAAAAPTGASSQPTYVASASRDGFRARGSAR